MALKKLTRNKRYALIWNQSVLLPFKSSLISLSTKRPKELHLKLVSTPNWTAHPLIKVALTTIFWKFPVQPIITSLRLDSLTVNVQDILPSLCTCSTKFTYVILFFFKFSTMRISLLTASQVREHTFLGALGIQTDKYTSIVLSQFNKVL